MTKASEFIEMVQTGCFTPYDGVGYFGFEDCYDENYMVWDESLDADDILYNR